MKTHTSAWEVAVAGVGRVRVDTSVLDQLLRGCAEVRWEIQSLQDQNVTVETLDPQAMSTDSDLRALRRALCDESEIEIQPVGEHSKPHAALWSILGSAPDRKALAELLGCDLYQPQILIHSATGDLTGQRALALASKIGAIGHERPVRLDDARAILVGLHQVGPDA